MTFPYMPDLLMGGNHFTPTRHLHLTCITSNKIRCVAINYHIQLLYTSRFFIIIIKFGPHHNNWAFHNKMWNPNIRSSQFFIHLST